MKKFFAFISATLLFYLLAPASAFAVGICPENNIGPSQQFGGLCDLNLETFENAIPRVITILLIFAVILAVLFLIIGGIKWVISGGDKAKVEGARGTIIAAIIGLIIALVALLIINVVLNLLGVTAPGGQFEFPNILEPQGSV